MKWYYSESNERRGPVSAEALLSLFNSQSIDAQTLVWRKGLSDWVEFSQIHSELLASPPPQPAAPPQPPAAPAAPRAVTGAGVKRCVECGFLYPVVDLLEIGGASVCAKCKPLLMQKMVEGLPVGGAGTLWRRKRQLVTGPEVEFPDRCVKCNGDAGGYRLKRPLFWHHPALYLLIFFPGLLIYLIVAMVVRKRTILHVGLCERHRAKRKMAILTAWIWFLLGVGLITLGANEPEGTWKTVALVTGILSIPGSLIWGVVGARIVHAARFAEGYWFVGGACPEFLAPLPEWNGK